MIKWILANTIKLNSPTDFKTGTRLFYELGYYADYKQTRWIKTGQLKEIPNPEEFIKREDRWNWPGWIDHHNFRLSNPH